MTAKKLAFSFTLAALLVVGASSFISGPTFACGGTFPGSCKQEQPPPQPAWYEQIATWLGSIIGG